MNYPKIFKLLSVRFESLVWLFLAVSLAWLPGMAAGKPPNIVLIMADDSAVDNYSCYGSDYFHTPNLDRLAETGAKFNYCYSEPVCTSSRVKIMTGRDNVRNYVIFGALDSGEITFGDMLKGAGYSTAIAGKWQLHGEPNGSLPSDTGFDRFCMWNFPGAVGDRYWNPNLVQDGRLLETSKTDYGPDITSDFLIDFIEDNKEGPFFVYYPMILVHNPFLPTPDSKPVKGRTKEQEALENYRDMVSYADKIVGKIINALERNGLRENTIVIFTADNGTNRSLTYPFHGEQRRGEKAMATERGSHVPLIVNAPGRVPEGIVCNDMVDYSDVLPTLAEISGAALPDVELDGRSFWPQCQGKQGNPREWIYQYYFPKLGEAAEAHGQGVYNREIIWAQNQHFKLYDDGSYYAVEDHQEVDNIAKGKGSKEAEQTRRMLQKAIDSKPKTSPKLKPEFGPPPVKKKSNDA
ncbi:MAG: sulfatase-like hydrolase/transferase [Verrucomicrobiae bacterium]|nr:sulfatase-like hydrolase/transferase [Verrucomicrobiae bacterium]